jgi:hypothetical protein
MAGWEDGPGFAIQYVMVTPRLLHDTELTISVSVLVPRDSVRITVSVPRQHIVGAILDRPRPVLLLAGGVTGHLQRR